MKSAYERAMERHGDGAPIASLTDEQKAALAEIDAKYKAKIAEKEMFLDNLIKQAATDGNGIEIERIEEQRRREISKLENDRDAEKDKTRESAV